MNEAIILAGGLGTRLRETLPDLPKCMATVAGRPFLFWVINHFRNQGISRFIFSLGYKHEVILQWLQESFDTLNFDVVVETSPLGTGGAIRLALQKTKSDRVLVLNGDSLFRVRLAPMLEMHTSNRADCTLGLKPMQDFERYGVVVTDETGKVMEFREKQFQAEGLINAGVYLLEKQSFLAHVYPEVFSFEKEFLEPLRANIYGHAEDAYFIDIGIPDDYRRANEEMQVPPLDLKKIDRSWTLFVDRDGVINPEKKGDYIRNLGEFSFYEGVPEGLRICAEKFGRVIIVSNQRGVGRGLMTENDLREIHRHLVDEVARAGGRVDAVYYCTSTDPLHPERKPNPGMAIRAAAEIPGIDLSKSLVLGNKLSDMRFGRHAGIYTVFIASTNPETPFPHPDIDLRFNSLPEFAKALETSQNFTTI